MWWGTSLSAIVQGTIITGPYNMQEGLYKAHFLPVMTPSRLRSSVLSSDIKYRKVSNIRRAKSQNLYASRLIL